MNKYTRVFILFALSLGLVACSTEQTETPGTDTPDTEQEVEEQGPDNQEESDTGTDETESEETEPENETVEFEDQVEETIEIEGMEEPMILNLYNHPDAIFLTYVPEDILVEEASGGEGESYKFHTNYEGEKSEEIYMELFIFADHMTEEPTLEDGDSTFATKVGEMEEAPVEEYWHDWSIKEFRSEDRSRHALLGEHNGQYFVMIVNSTPLYSEGFIPRVDKIINHFYWKDTGEYLVQE